MSDLIRRADAIEAVLGLAQLNGRVPTDSVIFQIKALPSAKLPKGDLISRADAIAYIDRVTNSGLGRNKSLDYIHKYISSLPSAEAVQGEWKIDEYGIYHCPFCHAINNTVYKSFWPNCGARMKGGAE